MRRNRTISTKILGAFLMFLGFSPAALAAETADGFRERLVKDISEGRPLVTTVYVALCDNDSQGIVPVRNRRICDGDAPDRNMYWHGSGGIHGYLKKEGWRKVFTARTDDVVLVTEVWKRRMFPGQGLKRLGVTKPFTAYTVALAYRGSRIHQANLDYLDAVNADRAATLVLKDGETISFGGASHLVGYIGHDYFMDAFEGTDARKELMAVHKGGDAKLEKGVFALACVSNEYVRPAITRDNVYILALNNFLTFPSAWTVGGILKGVAKGGDGRAIYLEAARAFSKGQKTGMRWAKKAFSHGP